MLNRIPFSTLALLALVGSAHAAIIHVDAAAPGGGNGSTWPAAYNDLAAALAAAQAGDEVWIARGVYHPSTTNDRSASFFLPSGVTVRGGFAGNESMLAQRPVDVDPASIDAADTVLSGAIGGPGADDNSYNVVQMNATAPGTMLERVVVAYGNNPGATGAGLIAVSAAGTIQHCLFTGNSAIQGAGLRVSGCVGFLVDECVFNTNLAGNAGAGALVDFSTAQFTGCLFSDNDSDYLGGGMAIVQGETTVTGCTFELGDAQYAGGVYAEGDALIERCLIRQNTAFTITGQSFTTGFGGGIYTKDGPTIVDCDIVDNWGHNSGAISNEGALGSSYINCRFLRNHCAASGGVGTLSQQGTWFVNCVFARNTSGFQGPLFVFRSFPAPASATLVNCTAVNNGAGAAAISSGGTLLILNSIFRNPGPEFTGNLPGVGWSNIEGFTGGLANIDADPLFANAGLDDYRLLPGSPCIDAGRNDQVPLDTPTDMDGNPRFVDDPAAPDTGVGSAPIVDMGAFEVQAAPPHCPGDADASGQVNFADITSVLTAFGTMVTPGGIGDADASGAVDFGDITSVLTNWGNACSP